MNLITAFYKFKTEGMEAVEDMFPEAVDFVNANRDRSFEEVEQELTADMVKA